MVGATRIGRILRHLAYPRWRVHRAFPRPSLHRIEEAIRACEREHAAELRFAVEGGLDFALLWRGATPRERAAHLFSTLRVWDTAENCGVLIYVQLVDRCIEIVADRGISVRVPQSEWDGACRQMESAFAQRNFEGGSLAGIRCIGKLLAQHFPSGPHRGNELPNQPVLL